ncbi:hypothetical protein ACFONC_11765 [Luteimonas soli]|uniref:Uncharacterized protein n=1 Tax=Luteimonas soli TaxID=1648966 RepID=A0ABV7XP78_9GAMM
MNAVAEHPVAGWTEVDIHELAASIADVASAALIQCECRCVAGSDHDWFDLKTCSMDSWHHVDQAVTYLERRGDAASHRLVRSKAFPTLVRIEERE